MGVVREFALPDLGEGLTEATIVRWLVAVGDTVKIDEPVVEVETAKALVEVPCPYGGVVTSHSAAEGAEVPVGAPLVTVAVGPDVAGAESGAATGPAAASEADGVPEPEHVGGSGNVLVGYGTGPAPKRRPRTSVRAPGAGTVGGAVGGAKARPTAGTEAGAGEKSRPDTRRDTPVKARTQGPAGRNGHDGGAGASRPVAVISPLVRRLAREHAVDLAGMTGTGPDGLILRADVERAVEEAHAQARTTPTAGRPRNTDTPKRAAQHASSGARSEHGAGEGARRIPLRGIRGTAAERMSRSRSEIPDASCWVDADATELLALRREMNAPPGHGAPAASGSAAASGSSPVSDSSPVSGSNPASGPMGGTTPPKVSLLALLARICTAALTRFPELNSTVDTEAREIVVLPGVHLGFAAQTDRGLVVPVVRNAHTLSAEQLSEEMARLTEAARAGTLSPAELTGGTFTLNNYGVFGVDGSTPIINHPEAAMLGVGRIARKPWVAGGELAVRDVVQLSFTFDHRVCDGGTAGGFLRHVADCVERPAVLLRTL
ncbi:MULTISPECIES: dihydrolipoamide acetyltransferase family protein [unclassified Streptomyces]|uniref:dihydrolipoamide acetyltransferase family protein n=1 Tax=unclassified Streptomyces TaxID=2593676 RepID=UPI002DD9F8FF|nr:dihydrolipoamide acetyltransferase family protein [Streptomyces sp. NBC_01795]WSA93575.1 2-oxo acid dehydrogenase subunit E2 [Streptomyces sp. NBC_01795]WSS42623.1 2-oxo acid dehydrogenase subunit E2 [Streptomyces sp. NBC_01187]